MLSRPFSISVLLVASVSAGAAAQGLSPAAIERRLRQAMWPEILIGVDGKPERPSFSTGARGDPAQELTIETISLIGPFEGLRVHKASPFRCSDCWEAPVAVFELDTVALTVIDPSDLATVLPLATPTLRYADTSAVRSAVLELLTSTCIVGCNPRLIKSKDQLSPTERRLARPALSEAEDWDVTPPRVAASNASVHDEFYVATVVGVYRLSIWQHARLSYTVSAQAVAYTTLSP